MEDRIGVYVTVLSIERVGITTVPEVKHASVFSLFLHGKQSCAHSKLFFSYSIYALHINIREFLN